MGLGSFCQEIDVHRPVCKEIGQFQLSCRAHCTTLPMVVYNSQDPFLGCGCVQLRCVFRHNLSLLDPALNCIVSY